MTRMHEFYFHEDDVGQERVLPIEWWAYCRGEFEALAEHSRTHLAPGGVGWTKMYEVREPDSGLPKLDMTEKRFHELLAPHGRRFDRLDSPLAEIDAELGIRAVGYGPSRRSGIIADLNEDKVGLLWAALHPENPSERDMLANMLTALSADQDLLLVDWAGLRLVDLRVRADVEAYLSV